CAARAGAGAVPGRLAPGRGGGGGRLASGVPGPLAPAVRRGPARARRGLVTLNAFDLQKFPEGTGEAGHHVFPVQALVRGQDLLRAVVTIDAGQAAGWVQDPDEPG